MSRIKSNEIQIDTMGVKSEFFFVYLIFGGRFRMLTSSNSSLVEMGWEEN